jgi:recombinational DNA repair protein (RecF pathway)
LLELVERVSKPDVADPELYDVVKQSLNDMNMENDLSVGQRWLALDRRAWLILRHEGFAPALDHCPRCNQPMPEDEISYSPGVGFVHVREAAAGDIRISAAAIAFLKTGQAPTDPRGAFREVHTLVESLIHHTLDQPLRSERVRRAVLRGAALSSG